VIQQTGVSATVSIFTGCFLHFADSFLGLLQ
jgi:hypothetical protein